MMFVLISLDSYFYDIHWEIEGSANLHLEMAAAVGIKVVSYP